MSDDVIEFQKHLINYIDFNLDGLSKVITHRVPPQYYDTTIEGAKEKVKNYTKLRDKICVLWKEFMNIPYQEILDSLNNLSGSRAFNDFSKLQIAVVHIIKL
jgi:ppGpp synthetase/RelA/SpoT-type nucleotidyltranferase